MGNTTRAAWLALLAAGCSQAHAIEEPDWVSGRRLRAWVHDGGGTRLFVGWRDTELDTDCELTATADGAMRCTPLARIARTYFGDAECTDALVSGLTSATFVTTTDAATDDDCVAGTIGAFTGFAGIDERDSVRAVHRIGVARAAPSDLYQLAADGTCSRAANPPHGPWRARGDEVALEEFVRAERVVTRLASGLSSVTLVADDGARQAAGLAFTETGEACAVGGPDRLRCLPVSTRFTASHVFGDAQCSTPTATVQFRAASCATPTLALELLDPGCGDEQLRRVMAPVADAFSTASGGCEPYAIEAGLVWTVGPPLTHEELERVAPPLERRDRGDGELRVARYVDSSGAPALMFGWLRHDGVGCTEVSFDVQGPFACVNTGLSFRGYSDAACTQRLAGGRCGLFSEHVVVGNDVLPVGETYGGTIYDDRNGCHEIAREEGVTYYRLGAPVDPTTFPQITRVLE